MQKALNGPYNLRDFMLIPEKTIQSFSQSRVSGPAAQAARDVVNTFPGAVGAAACSAAIKSSFELFIREQYDKGKKLQEYWMYFKIF